MYIKSIQKICIDFVFSREQLIINYYYKIIIEPQEKGGYTAYVPKLPGCASEGETYDETLENIKEAIELYLETLKERNETIINDDTHISAISISF